MRIFLCVLMLVGSLRATAADSWDGYFAGISFGNVRNSSNQSYSHAKGRSVCDNNNYGSMGNGAGCGGTEDLEKDYSGSSNKSSITIKLGRYWQESSYVFGLSTEYNKNSTFSETNSEIITSAFGDTLSLTAKRADSISVLGLFGYPINNFLPFFTAGISNANVRASVTQNLAGYNLPRSFSDSNRVWGYTLGAGLKWMFTQNLILSGEYLYSDYKSFKIRTDSFMPPTGGGLMYPSTSVDTSFDEKNFRLGLEYKF